MKRLLVILQAQFHCFRWGNILTRHLFFWKIWVYGKGKKQLNKENGSKSCLNVSTSLVGDAANVDKGYAGKKVTLNTLPLITTTSMMPRWWQHAVWMIYCGRYRKSYQTWQKTDGAENRAFLKENIDFRRIATAVTWSRTNTARATIEEFRIKQIYVAEGSIQSPDWNPLFKKKSSAVRPENYIHRCSLHNLTAIL